MTIAVDLGRKATKQTNKQTGTLQLHAFSKIKNRKVSVKYHYLEFESRVTNNGTCS